MSNIYLSCCGGEGGGGGGAGYNNPCNYLVPLFMVISEAYNGKKKKLLILHLKWLALLTIKSLPAKNIFEEHFLPIFNNLFQQSNLSCNFIDWLSES